MNTNRLVNSPLLWPVLSLAALLAVNVMLTPGFLSIRVQDGHLFGSVIDILRNGAPTMLVALGMTLVIASRGIDLSVGAVVAVSGALACA
ncbi:sugar ABC transporter permease, partial [Enterococcus faecium]